MVMQKYKNKTKQTSSVDAPGNQAPCVCVNGLKCLWESMGVRVLVSCTDSVGVLR